MSCEGRRHFLRGVSPNLAANDSTEPHGLMQRVELRSRICPNDSTRAKRKNVLRKKSNAPRSGQEAEEEEEEKEEEEGEEEVPAAGSRG